MLGDGKQRKNSRKKEVESSGPWNEERSHREDNAEEEMEPYIQAALVEVPFTIA